MAKQSYKTKSLVYQESFFPNRNNMLQSAADAVLLKIQNDQVRYETEVELYKEQTKILTQERQRLEKLRADLIKGQATSDAAAVRFNASAKNSASRAQYAADNAAARAEAFANARTEYAEEYSLSAEAGRIIPEKQRIESNIAYNANRTDVVKGFEAINKQYAGSAEVAGTSGEQQVTKAGLALIYVADELKDTKYETLPVTPEEKERMALEAVIARLPKSEQDAVKAGIQNLGQAGAGKGRPPRVSVDSRGKISVQQIKGADFSGLLKETEAKLAGLEQVEKPEAPKEPDFIDLQRREYFDKFYTGYVPRYEMNEMMQKLIDLPDADAQALKNLYESRYAPSQGVQGSTREPGSTGMGRALPTTPGGIIGGEGSPFIPTDRFSAKGREILGNIPSNQFYLEEMTNPTEAGLQERANLLFAEGFGLQKTVKEDGRTLYTVIPFDRLGQYPADQVVMPSKQAPESVESLTQKINALRKEMAAATAGAAGGLSPFNIFASIAGEGATADVGMQSLAGKQAALDSLLEQRFVLETKPSSITPQEDMRIAQQNVRIGEGEPFNPAKYDAEIVALTGDLDRIGTNLAFLKETAVSGTPEYDESRRLEAEYAVKDNELNNLLMRRGNMQAKVDGAGIEPKKEYPITGDRAEVRRILNDPERQRYKAPMDYDKSEPAPAPPPAPRKKIDLGEQEQVSDFEISKTQFVEDPTNPDYRYRQNEAGGFDVEFKGQLAKPAEKESGAAKAIERVLAPRPRKVIEEIKIESSPTPEQTDARIKLDAAEKAKSIYGTSDFNKLLNTELGKAVSDLYAVNKAKGDESGGEILSYIATEFPRAEDQNKAAQILMGLSYGDKNKGLLKA